MAKKFCTILFFTLCVTALLSAAMPFGISVGTWASGASFASAGTHASVGAVLGLAPYLEVESNLTVGFSPTFASTILGSVGINIPLVTPLYFANNQAPLYYNAFLSLGYLGGYDRVDQKPLHALFVRLTPFTLGGPYYSRRERALAFSLLYDLEKRALGVAWNLFGFDLFLTK